MKNILFILFALSLIIISCRKKGDEPIFGQISSLSFDGKQIIRPNMTLQILGYDGTSRCNIQQYSIAIKINSPNNDISEKIGILDIPMSKTGIIKVNRDTSINSCDTLTFASYHMTEGGDVTVATFIPLRNADNFINIQSFNAKTKEAKGKFKLTLVNTDYSQYPKQFGYRDTIVFESGDFTVPCVN